MVNISKPKLTKDEAAVLAKGLNNEVALERIPHNDFIVATELAAVELIKQHPNKDPRYADVLRSEVLDIFFKSHLPKSNLFKDERKPQFPVKKERPAGLAGG